MKLDQHLGADSCGPHLTTLHGIFREQYRDNALRMGRCDAIDGRKCNEERKNGIPRPKVSRHVVYVYLVKRLSNGHTREWRKDENAARYFVKSKPARKLWEGNFSLSLRWKSYAWMLQSSKIDPTNYIYTCSRNRCQIKYKRYLSQSCKLCSRSLEIEMTRNEDPKAPSWFQQRYWAAPACYKRTNNELA
jgi:hypothetical protein